MPSVREFILTWSWGTYLFTFGLDSRQSIQKLFEHCSLFDLALKYLIEIFLGAFKTKVRQMSFLGDGVEMNLQYVVQVALELNVK